MRSLKMPIVAGLALCFFHSAGWADTVKYTVTLEPDKQGTPGKGTANLSLDTDSKTLTGTIEYDLWANVVSRLELRWDHALDNLNLIADGAESLSEYDFDTQFQRDSVGLYANIIYKF